MTKDDIIRMAREAGGGTTWWPLHTNTLERLVELVRAAEREVIAKMVEDWDSDSADPRDIADATRARGNT